MIPWCQTHSLSDMAALLYCAASLLARVNAISHTIPAVAYTLALIRGIKHGDILGLSWPTWIRTTIHRFKVCCPAVRRWVIVIRLSLIRTLSEVPYLAMKLLFSFSWVLTLKSSHIFPMFPNVSAYMFTILFS